MPDVLASLGRLDELLAAAVQAAEDAYGAEAAADPHRGLYVAHEEAVRLLRREPGAPLLAPALGAARPPVLAELRASFDLDAFDVDVLLLALAPELDLKYERLFGFLQDDVTKRRPTVDLALALLCHDAAARLAARERFADEAPLVRHRLLSVRPPAGEPDAPLPARVLHLDDAFVRLLLGRRSPDPRLASSSRLQAPTTEALPAGVEPGLERARAGEQTVLAIHGRRGSGRRTTAAAIAAELGLDLLTVDLERALDSDAPLGEALAVALRDARLQRAVPCLVGLDAVTEAPARRALLDAIEGTPCVVVTSERGWWSGPRPAGLVEVSLAPPDAAARRRAWSRYLDGASADVDVESLAGRFRFTHGEIAEAVARARAGAGEGELSTEALFAAARAEAAEDLGPLARRIEPSRTWDDLVLPDDRLEQLHALCVHVRFRARVYEDWGFGRRLSLGKGVSALFAGPSGTGKTLAAEVVANELGLDLYKIDLAGIVSKYIGETEKNLARIFDAAETADAILFFDEADALFGKRSEIRDSHDRYANIEIAYLLQRLDDYEGVAILATNLRKNMDEAFVRRLQSTIEFPLPDAVARRRIWEGIWPDQTPRASDVDLPELAARYELAGGNIRNIALAAAFGAASDGGILTMDHLLHATRREYEKLGKILSEGEFAPAPRGGGRR